MAAVAWRGGSGMAGRRQARRACDKKAWLAGLLWHLLLLLLAAGTLQFSDISFLKHVVVLTLYSMEKLKLRRREEATCWWPLLQWRQAVSYIHFNSLFYWHSTSALSLFIVSSFSGCLGKLVMFCLTFNKWYVWWQWRQTGMAILLFFKFLCETWLAWHFGFFLSLQTKPVAWLVCRRGFLVGMWWLGWKQFFFWVTPVTGMAGW